MGLKETIQGLVPVAFSAIGNLSENVTYKRLEERHQTYNPTTGEVVPVFLKHTSIPCVPTEYDAAEVDGTNILSIDRLFLIPKASLPITPRPGDIIERFSGESWKVINPSIDPADALWNLQVRIIDDAPGT